MNDRPSTSNTGEVPDIISAMPSPCSQRGWLEQLKYCPKEPGLSANPNE